MVIDSHQHFWRIGQNDCTWPTANLSAIYRDFGPRELMPPALEAGIDGTVLVQSQPSDRDTDFLLELARHCDIVKAVVGWVDFEKPSAPTRIADLARHPKLRSLRPMLQNLPKDDWILNPAFDAAVQVMLRHNLCFDALVYPRHLRIVRAFAMRYPALPIVINHGAKPPIHTEVLEPWREDMRALADLPNIYCKLSGLVTEAGPQWDVKRLQPYADHLVQVFGPDRLMWGSDWPVLELASRYDEWLAAAGQLAGFQAENAKRKLFGDVARRFYRI